MPTYCAKATSGCSSARTVSGSSSNHSSRFCRLSQRANAPAGADSNPSPPGMAEAVFRSILAHTGKIQVDDQDSEDKNQISVHRIFAFPGLYRPGPGI